MMDKLLLQALESGDKDQILKALKVNIPPKLYKYVWLDGSEKDKEKFDTLSNNQLWISRVSKFNDPFEFKGFYLNEQRFREYKFSEDVIRTYKNIIDIKDTYGICCLSNADLNNLPMWAYYTNNYEGFCIEYDVIKKDKIFEVLYEPRRIPIANILIQMGKDIYNVLPKDSSNLSSNDLERIFDEKEAELINAGKYADILMQQLFIKSEQWSHEREFRIPYLLSKEDKNGKKVSISELGLKTSKVVCGFNCSEKARFTINSISNKIGCGNAFQIKLSNTEYKIIETRI